GWANFFNCNRNLIDCGTGSTCVSSTGFCTCGGATPDQVNDYNPCQHFAASPDCTTKTCQNGGTCKNLDTGGETCFCDDLHYGDTCEKNRVIVDCTTNPSLMAITVRPYPDVVRAYALNFPNTADSCTFSSTVTGPDQLALVEEFGEGGRRGSTTVEVKVVVQHTVNPDILMTSDLVLTASCVLGATSGGTEAQISDVGTIGSNLQPLTTVTTDTVNPVTMQVQYASPAGTEVSGSVPLGTKLNLVIFMQNNASECPVYANGIVEEGHSLSTSATLGSQSGTAVTVPVIAIKFGKGTSTIIKFTCMPQVCANAADAACTPPTAATCTSSNGLAPFGRRRRREASVEERTLETGVVVIIPGTQTAQSTGSGNTSTQQPETTKDCLSDSRTLAIISVLAVFVIVLLVACLIVAYCAAKRIRRGKGGYYDNSAYSSSQNMSIPRPKV
ncbi:hypothetical protein BaRGS_00025134, partial [Batillaria attramentaria]